MKQKSYNQKAAAYWSILKANPNISANEIGRRYHKKPLGMRKDYRNSLVKEMKATLKFQGYLTKSDFPGKVKDRLNTQVVGYKQAKLASKHGKILHPENKRYPRRSMKQQTDIIFGAAARPDMEFNKYTAAFALEKAEASGLKKIWEG